MRALLDINVLIARLDGDHLHHARARAWLKENIKSGWASCPLTQNGCICIMSQPGYPQALPAAAVAERLAAPRRARRITPSGRTAGHAGSSGRADGGAGGQGQASCGELKSLLPAG